MDVLTSAKLGDVKVGPESVSMSVEVGGQTQQLTVDKVLVAAGRAPNVEEVGLKELGIQLTERGFVKIDERFETNVKGIYAIGDVAGNQMLAHKGSREGHVLADLLAGEHTHPVNYKNIPSCTYCHPEVASIGLTEQQCKDQKLDYKVGRFPFSANGRARTSGETDGFVKILRDAKYGEILGAHIVGAHATEMIHELAVARENEYTVEEIDLACTRTRRCPRRWPRRRSTRWARCCTRERRRVSARRGRVGGFAFPLGLFMLVGLAGWGWSAWRLVRGRATPAVVVSSGVAESRGRGGASYRPRSPTATSSPTPSAWAPRCCRAPARGARAPGLRRSPRASSPATRRWPTSTRATRARPTWCGSRARAPCWPWRRRSR
jgi:hypothetical protein